MSGISVGPAKIVLVESDHRNRMDAYVYKDRLTAVLAIIDNGGLGGEGGYGCEAHKAALDQVENQIKETRKSIAEMERDDLLNFQD